MTNLNTAARLRPALFVIMLCLGLCGRAGAQDSGAMPAGQAPGAPAGTYPTSDFESINLFNGHLNFRLPLVTAGGRGGARHTVQFVAEQTWVMESFYDSAAQRNFYYQSDDWRKGPAPGFSPGVMQGYTVRYFTPDGCPTNSGLFTHPQTLSYVTFTAPDGTQYNLYSPHGRANHSPCAQGGFSRGKVFATADGSAATFISDADVTEYAYPDYPTEFTVSGHLLLRNGTRYKVLDGRVTEVRDRNGNKLTVGYNAHGVHTVTDPLGRTVTINYGVEEGGDYGVSTQIVYSGFGGVERVVRLSRKNLGGALRDGYSLQPHGADATPYETTVTSSVWLPDGRRYRLFYNDFAELARVELPTGGAVEYDHDGGLEGGDPEGVFEGGFDGVGGNRVHIYRRLVERRVYPDGGTGENWRARMTVSKPEGVTAAQTTGYVEVKQYEKRPDGAVTLQSCERHYFNGGARPTIQESPFVDPPSGGDINGREGRTEIYDTAGGVVGPLLRKVEHVWLPGDALVEGAHISETRTTLSDTGQSARQTFSYDRYGNQTDVWEYGYGAPQHPSRHTRTEYVTDAAYVNVNLNPVLGASIRGLPRARKVYAVNTTTGAETLVAKSETRYDEAALLPCGTTQNPIACSSAPQWDDPGAAPRGNATTTRSWLDTTNSWLETHAEYDQLGNVRLSRDARQNVSEVTYLDSFCNGNGCGGAYTQNTFGFPTATKSPKPDQTGTHGSASELTASTVYDFYTGLAYSTTDANGQITHFEYESQPNKLDRLKAVARPGGGRTDFDYGDTAGNLYLRTLADLDGERRTESKRYFDGLGRAYRQATLESHDPEKPWLVADTEYDALGRVRRFSMPYRAAEAAARFSTDRWVESVYDSLSRVLTVKTKPDNAVARTDYIGNRVLVTDQDTRQRISETDALGRLTEVWEVTPNDSAKYPGVGPIPTAVTAGLPVSTAHGYGTQYFYDAVGNLRRVKQGAQQRFFAYDSLGRLVRAKNPEQGDFTPGGEFPALTDPVSGNPHWSLGYVYDTNGNLTKRIDARGAVATYGYDALNRNITITYAEAGGTATTPDVSRYYDNNPLAGSNGRGRLWKSEASQTAQTIVDSYDEAGRPKKQTQKFWVGSNWEQARAYTTTFTYNLAGGVTSVVYPSGNGVSYNYDAAGRLGDGGAQPAFKGTLGDGAERTYASQVSYDALGGMRDEKFGTQTPLYHKLHYNARGQLYDIRLSTVSWAADQWEWNRGAVVNYYDRDCQWKASDVKNNGNLRCSEHAVPLDPNGSYTPGAAGAFSTSYQTYSYDALNRLTGVTEKKYKTGETLTPAFTQAYRYDRWGNRTIDAAETQVYGQNPGYSIPEPQFGVDPLTNRLGVPAGQPGQMAYDPAGNLTTDTYQGGEGGGGLRAYDAENRMTSAQFLAGQTQTAAYTYDADGRRVKRKAGVAAEVWQIYGAGGELLAEYAAGASHLHPLKEYGYRGGELLVTADAPTPRTNFALASAGATATALRYTPDGAYPGLHFQPAYVNDGVRYVSPQGDRYWRDGVGLPTWVQVDFAGARTIGEVDVYTLADYPAYETQADPTASQTFTQYGVTSFEVQYWTGSEWATVPGGSVSGNNLLWRKVTFPALTTDKVRVRVTSSVDGVARITEVEAWEAARANFALASRGAQASASSTTPDTDFPGMTFPVTGVNDGDRKGLDWEHGGGWRDGTNNAYPDWAQVEFAGEKTIDEVNVFTLQDATSSPSEPTEAMTFTQYGVTAYEVQYLSGADWVTVPGGSVSGNDKVWRRFTFPAVVTSKVRVLIHNALAGRSRLVEVEAWGTSAGSATADVRWLVSDHLGTPRMVVDQTGNLSGVTRHDYLPFGEELSPGVGGRSPGQGFSGDEIRQKFALYERDGETGLDYLQARYYGSALGRFTGVDPDNAGAKLTDPQSWNGYAYASNNPLKYIDPSGMTMICRNNGQVVSCASVLDAIRQGNFQTVTYTNSVGVSMTVRRADFIRRESYTTQDEVEGVRVTFNHTAFLAAAGRFSKFVQDELDENGEKPIGGGGFGGAGDFVGGGPGGDCPSCPALNDDIYNPDVVRARNERPQYVTNPVRGHARSRFNPRKTPEPADAQEVYGASVRADMGTWIGKNARGEYYQFYSAGDGTAHFAGKIPESKVPKNVRQQLAHQ